MNKLILKKYFFISVVSTILLFLSFNFIINKINFNIGLDFTSTKTFTLSKGTKNVLANIEEPLKIEFIYSRSLSKNIPIIQNYATQIEGLLNRYESLAKGKIDFQIIEPEPYSDQEDYVERSGVQGFPVGLEGSNIYFGLIATNTTYDLEIIPCFGPSKGGSLENALVVKDKEILNEDGLRNSKEFVNHNILDCIGDLYTCGYRMIASINCSQGGNYLTNQLLRKVFENKDNFSIVEIKERSVPHTVINRNLLRSIA